MINELFELSNAMKKSGVKSEKWHRKYRPIPNATAINPCVKIVTQKGRITQIQVIKPEIASILRKYGTNQGSFPCLNLAPLYRITDEEVKKSVKKLKPEQIDDKEISRIRSWCIQNNWNRQFRNKYLNSMIAIRKELSEMKTVTDFCDFATLIKDTEAFQNPEYMHDEIEKAVFGCIERGENFDVCMKILFYQGDPEKTPEKDFGTLSVVLESDELIEKGMPSVSAEFVRKLNSAILNSEEKRVLNSNQLDAFGYPLDAIGKPMPSVKLAGGFDATLRTMFGENYCQYRYGRADDASYPISDEVRMDLQAALSWLGSPNHKDIYWLNTDKNEILFAYPGKLPERTVSYVKHYKRNDAMGFRSAVGNFLKEIEYPALPRSTIATTEMIQVFVLRKIDKARTKIIYSKITNIAEIKKRSEAWILGATRNLPENRYSCGYIPYPLSVCEIMSRIWRRDEVIVLERYKPYASYRGLEIYLNEDEQTERELHTLVEQNSNIVQCVSRYPADIPERIFFSLREHMSLIGILLYQKGIIKEKYMSEYSYLFGRLLKVADEIQRLYCSVVRNGQMPTQFVASMLFQSAMETPGRTLPLLALRLSPYISWAKSYAYKDQSESGNESWRARWLLRIFEEISEKLYDNWTEDKYMNDNEKALMFLGYMAKLPKSKIHNEENYEMEENNDE